MRRTFTKYPQGYVKASDSYTGLRQISDEEAGTLPEIPKDFIYDTETRDFYCYRNKYTGEEIHIIKPPKTYVLDNSQGDMTATSINQILEQIKSDIERVMQEPAYQHEGEDWQVGLNIAENIIDEYIK